MKVFIGEAKVDYIFGFYWLLCVGRGGCFG